MHSVLEPCASLLGLVQRPDEEPGDDGEGDAGDELEDEGVEPDVGAEEQAVVHLAPWRPRDDVDGWGIVRDCLDLHGEVVGDGQEDGDNWKENEKCRADII